MKKGRNTMYLLLVLFVMCLVGCAKGKEPEKEAEKLPTVTEEVAKATPTEKPAETKQEEFSGVWHGMDMEQLASDGTILCEALLGDDTITRCYITVEGPLVKAYRERENWLENNETPWLSECDMYITDWEGCDFYLFVYGYESKEDPQHWAYRKVSKETFLAVVFQSTVDRRRLEATGEIAFSSCFPVSIKFDENGRIVQVAEVYLP